MPSEPPAQRASCIAAWVGLTSALAYASHARASPPKAATTRICAAHGNQRQRQSRRMGSACQVM